MTAVRGRVKQPHGRGAVVLLSDLFGVPESPAAASVGPHCRQRAKTDTIAVMSHLALGEFLDDLEHERRLVRIPAEVDPELELTAISHRAARQQGPALLLANIRGRGLPLATNLLHTSERICQ